MTVGAVILAAGCSERMGRPKALLPCGESTFLGAILDTLSAARVETVRVVLGHASEEVITHVKLPEEMHVINPRYDAGMLSSVQCGVRALPPHTDAFFLWPVDHPLVRTTTVARLVERHRGGGHLIVLPTHRGRRGHPVLFAACLAQELLEASASVGARAVVRAHTVDLAEEEVDDEGVVTDIDDPETFRRAFGRSISAP